MDANIRPLRWGSEALCRETIMSFVEQANLLKLTEEELFFLTETETIEDGVAKLAAYQYSRRTHHGGENRYVCCLGRQMTHVGVEPVEPVDTTGAGDAFVAGILRQIHLKGQPETVKNGSTIFPLAINSVHFVQQNQVHCRQCHDLKR